MCDEAFRSETNLSNHFKAKHVTACNTCGQEFLDIAKKQEHNLSAHNVRCDKCGLYFDTATHLQFHYKSKVHKIKCTVCYDTFDAKSTAEEHFQLVHVLKCDMCVKVCTSIGELQLHYSVMHQLQPLQLQNGFAPKTACGVCNLFFAAEEDLIDHYQNTHVEK